MREREKGLTQLVNFKRKSFKRLQARRGFSIIKNKCSTD
jgi:hypothetical protein